MQKSKYKIIFIGAAILLIAALVTAYFCGSEFLVIKDFNTGEVIAEYEINDGGEFAVSFIHSVNKSLVKEGYLISGDTIYLETCLYSAFGAGVATEVVPPQKLEFLEDGSMLISGFHTEMKKLLYFVGTASNPTLYINGEEIDLKALCGAKRNIEFKVEKQFTLFKF